MIKSFYENESLLSILQMSYYPKRDIHIKKGQSSIDLSNYATKKS